MAKKGRIERNERVKGVVSKQHEKRELLKKLQKDIYARHSIELSKVKEEFSKKLTLLKEDYEKDSAEASKNEQGNFFIAAAARQENEHKKIQSLFENRKNSLDKKNPNYKNLAKALDLGLNRKLSALNLTHALEDKNNRNSQEVPGKTDSTSYKKYIEERNKLILQCEEKERRIIQEGSRELFTTSIAFQKIKRDGSATRIRKRCAITGRPRAYFGLFGLSRNVIRESASFGLIMGLTKSSW